MHKKWHYSTANTLKEIKKKTKNFFLYVYVPKSMYIQIMHVSAHGIQKRVLEPPELELQIS